MSTTIDNRVVEMRFDNKHFKDNVQDTLSILDKLKQKLNFKGASDGLENVSSAAKKVNFNGLNGAIDTVHAKFSAMDVIATTALANITNSAVNAGKKIVSALTIDPVKTGFQEYETQINAVQTIQANTSHNGTTIEEINDALRELNEYADQTIYNFTEMTRNIGTFTAAGVDLKTSTASIKGIANLAAVSGSTSQQASTAMYQLSQALAAGRVSLMDWNSVVNAGMGGKVFQDALIRTSETMKTGANAAIKKYGSFRESLTQGKWLTVDVLTETLNQFTMAAEEGSTEWENYKKSLKEKGYTEAQAIEILKMANTATDAATKVKTFTQLWDVLKESVQSGWAQTWQLIFGDFEEAKSMLSPLAKFMTGVIDGMSDFRNKIIAAAMGSPFGDIVEKIKGVTDATNKVVEATKKYEEIVNEVIRGKWGNGQERWNKLAEAGYNWAKVQNMVNEKLGNSKRHNEELAEAQIKTNEAQKKDNKVKAETIEQLTKLSDAELKELGLKDEEIKSFRELEKISKKTGYTMKEIFDNPDILSGRSLLIDSFKNFGKVIVEMCKVIRDAWVNIFYDGAKTEDIIEGHAMSIYNLIASLRGFSARLVKLVGESKDADSAAGKIRRTLQGVFAIIDIITTIVGGGFKLAFKIVVGVLKAFDLNLLDVTANLGDALVGIKKMFDGLLESSGIFDVIGSIIKNLVDIIKYFFNMLTNSGVLKLFIQQLKETGKAFSDWIAGFKEAESIPKHIGNGLINGLKWIVKKFDEFADHISGNISKLPNDLISGLAGGIWSGAAGIVKTVANLGILIIETICNILGIHSPSKVMIAIGGFLILGLVEGLTKGEYNLFNKVVELGNNIIAKLKDVLTKGDSSVSSFSFKNIIDALKNAFSDLSGTAGKIVEGISNLFGELDWGAIFTVASIGSLVFIGHKLSKALSTLASPLDGLSDVFEATKGALKSFSMSVKARAVLAIAEAVVLLTGAIIAMTFVDQGKLWSSVGAIALLMGALIGLTAVVGKFASTDLGEMGKFAIGMIAISASVLVLAAAFKMLAGIESGVGQAAIIMGVMLAAIAGMAFLASKISWKSVMELGVLLLSMAGCIAILAFSVKMVSQLDADAAIKGGIAIAALGVVMLGLAAFTKLINRDIVGVGSTLIKMSAALLLMLFVAKLASKMDPEDLIRGGLIMSAFGILLAEFAIITRLATGEDKKIGSQLLAMVVSLGLMVIIAKTTSKLTPHEIERGIKVIAMFELLIAGMLVITRIAPEHEMKGVASTILAMALAIGIMAGVTALIGLLKPETLKKGLITVGLLSAFMTAMIWATRGANDCKGNLIVMAATIALLAVSVASLSQIPAKDLLPAVGSIALLMGMFAVMMKSANFVQGAWKTMLAMSVVVILLSGIVFALSKLIKDGDNAIKSAIAVSLLMVAMAGAMTIASKFTGTGMNALKGVGLLAAMALPIIAFALAIRTVPDLTGKEKSIATLTAVMGAMTLLLIPLAAAGALIGKLGGVAGGLGAAGALAALAVMAGELWLFGKAIENISDVSDKEASLKTIATAMTAMTLILIPLTAIGAIIGVTGGIAGLGLVGAIIALTAMAYELALFGDIINELPEVSDKTASLFTILTAMRIMTDLLIQVSIISPLALAAVGAIAAMEGLLLIFGAIVTLIGFIDEHCDNFEKFIDSGCQILIKIANALGQVIGAFVGGIAEGVVNSLPNIADTIALFVKKMGAVADDAKKFDEDAITGIGNIVKMVGSITGASLLEKITSFVTGESSMDAFLTQIEKFATGIVAFSDTIAGKIDTESVNAAANAGAAVATLYEHLPKTDGWAQKIFGESGDISNFASDMVAFGKAVVAFSGAVKGKVDKEAVENAANAGIAVAKLYEHLPKEGGWMQKIFGEQTDFKAFKADLTAFADGIVAFSDKVKGNVDKKSVENAAAAGETMATLQESLPKTDGWVQNIFGDADLGTFGTQLQTFGEALVAFSTAVSEGLTADAVSAAENAGKVMIELQNSIPEDKWFDGKMDLADFGKKIEKFGGYIAAYSKKVSGIDNAAVKTSNETANILVDVAKKAGKVNKDDITNFKEVKGIGEAIKAYSDKVTGLDAGAVKTSVSAVGNLVKSINNMANMDASGVAVFKSSIRSLAEINFEGFISAFNEASGKLVSVGTDMVASLSKGITSGGAHMTTSANVLLVSFANGLTLSSTKCITSMNVVMTNLISSIITKQKLFVSAGDKVMSSFSKGLKGSSKFVTDTFSSKLSSALAVISGYYTTFYGYGSMIVDGFARGIKDSAWRASAAATAMADAARVAAKEALKINSPSKVFKAIGNGVPEGFAMGIDQMSRLVSNSTENMGSTAIDSVKNSLNHLVDLASGDMDTQPTIRPVLDLTNVEEGASSIGSLLGLSPSINAMTNAKAINSLMNQRSQNGTTGDIISAINKLRKDLGNAGSSTYNLNGLTYNEGSDVAEAFKTIVRAATIERRV